MKSLISISNRYLTISLFILLVSSCKKETLVTNPKYVGFWSGGEYCREYIQINSDGSGKYWVKSSGECGSWNLSDNDIESNGSSFKIDNIKFKIITPPTVIDTFIYHCGYCGLDVYVTEFMELKKGFLHRNDQSKYYRMGPKAE